ncbi:tripartite motif-containing protein 64 [Homo sapiens]|uniref:Tripartite motif-containing protein 64 n=1 Tax=Homo sapiens TaxID=9606 RepID=TRI64_HUMAN|nr:tripartite motif-containing protein 64 [Homo sapiens]A6NGJ6.4 RecName: Full=Tripartite motif-containing protein 64 [Homo sapiens]|eukprot:NP_001129958.1 tripartite motif-containing protein 64 [Homo sapiens]
MDSDDLQVFQNELICCICVNYFIDPVTIDCGHSFCRPCLCLCSEEGRAPMRCPSCRKISEKPNFNTNVVLKKLSSLARQTRPQNINSSDNICVLHEETKELFCEADKRLLCGPCSESPEHMAHSHSPIGWAAEECREKLIKEMDYLWEINQETRNNLNQETRTFHSLKDYVSVRKRIITIQYQKMPIFLDEEEQRHLQALEREAEELFQQLQDSQVRMTQHLERMKDMYRELWETCHVPDVELLQDVRNVSARTDLAQMQKPQPVNPELTSWCITGVLDMLNNFRVDSALSTEMIPCYISLSEDVRYVIFGDDHLSAPTDPQGVDSFAVWGAQAFTSGKHYWEVDVTLSSNWILGVCQDSRTADANFVIDSDERFFLISSKRSNHYSLSTNSPPLIQYVQRPLGQVGVFLDYDNGSVSFFDVSKGSLIYGFPPSSFSSPLRPFFCFGCT